MYKSLKILGAAAAFAVVSSAVSAAPMSSPADGLANGVSSSVIDVQGYRDRDHDGRRDGREFRGRWDRTCRRGPGGWYRINRFGERRPCRNWDGRGRRPDACVKVGPVWLCDY
jgi:hypothetical protein